MLAADILRSAPQGAAVVAVDRAQCDVTNPAALRRTFTDVGPDLVINASGYTAVDRAERERPEAEAVNGVAVGFIGSLAAAGQIFVVHFSTDYVFSGATREPYSEYAATGPVNAYGVTKLLGERLLRESGARSLIIRTQWLFGARGMSFPRLMWDRAHARQPTRVVNDQWGRPTSAADLASAAWALIERGATGIVHAANSGAPATWFQFAERVFTAADATALLSPCATTDYPTAARRPAYSVLATARLEQLLGRPMPLWTTAVDRFLADVIGHP
jgi:dTDP-4-dehydrorhamnose reductase